MTEEWIKRIQYTHTVEYHSALRKNKTLPFAATWMDLEIVILSEVSRVGKDKYHIYCLCVESKQKWYK